MHDRPADGITVKEHKKGHSEGDPETRWDILAFCYLLRHFFRISQEDRDNRVERDDEFSDSEDEGEGGRRNQDDFSKQGAAPTKSTHFLFYYVTPFLIYNVISDGDAMET